MDKDSRLEKELNTMYTLQKEFVTFEKIKELLSWDQHTYMPVDGNDTRSEEHSLISKLAHGKITSKELKDSVFYLLEPENFEKLNDKDKIVVKKLYKKLERNLKLPTEFVETLSHTASKSLAAWQEAKKNSEFEIFQPHLEKIVDLKKEEAKLVGLPGHPYNSLLDEFEEGMTVDKLNTTFNFLGSELTKLLKKIQSSDTYKNQNEKVLRRKFSKEKQEKASNVIFKLMNLPVEKSRLDVSSHPMTMGMGKDDVRITTRYIANPLESLTSTMHEGGHALYELGMPREYEYTVVNEAPSLGMHESQSRFWENMIGRSKSFWKHFFPVYKNIFKQQLKDVSFEDWFKIVNMVQPSFIRVEADEMTYCLHVILRYEIEQGLMDGSISVKELPKVWNEKFEKMLGICPRNDSEGVLQDIHWSEGYIGYFPTYALGTVYAAQLYNQLVKENSNIEKEIEAGKLENINPWLNDKVHKYGRSLTAEEIIIKVCDEGLNPKAYIEYLDKKYSEIYNI